MHRPQESSTMPLSGKSEGDGYGICESWKTIPNSRFNPNLRALPGQNSKRCSRDLVFLQGHRQSEAHCPPSPAEI